MDDDDGRSRHFFACFKYVAAKEDIFDCYVTWRKVDGGRVTYGPLASIRATDDAADRLPTTDGLILFHV